MFKTSTCLLGLTFFLLEILSKRVKNQKKIANSKTLFYQIIKSESVVWMIKLFRFPVKNCMPLDVIFPSFSILLLFLRRTRTTVTNERGWYVSGHYTPGNASATGESLKHASDPCTMRTTIPQTLLRPVPVRVLSTAILICETTAVAVRRQRHVIPPPPPPLFLVV